MLRVIREVEPPTPRSRISTSEALPSLAATRHVEPARLSRFVRGDLDWIVMKALAKERERRYDSAIGLANDVERFLNHEPVTAGPPTAAYRLRKFVRRNRGRGGGGGAGAAGAGRRHRGDDPRAAGGPRGPRGRNEASRRRKAGEGKRDGAANRSGEELREEAQKQERIALDKAEQLAREDYVNRVNRAYREVQDDNVALAEDLLHGCDPKRRGWEWHFVERLCNSERRVIDLGNTSVNALAFSPDGTWAVSGSGAPDRVGSTPMRRRPSTCGM